MTTTSSTGGIRPVRRGDLPAVAALHERVAHPGAPRDTAVTADRFARLFLDQPWSDRELPSLVYEAPGGEIVGFLGSNVRRMRLDGRPVRVGCCSNLVVHADHRSRGVGVQLARRYLIGPQDLTVTDSATEEMRRIWAALKGRTLLSASIGWSVVFRPVATADAARPSADPGPLRRTAGSLAGPLDALAARLPVLGRRLRPPPSDLASEPLTPGALTEHVATAARRVRLVPDYDPDYVTWLFGEVAAHHPRARLVARTVRTATGRCAGWYVYLARPAGIAQVLQFHVAAGEVEAVFDHLLGNARDRGAAAIQGRLEPVLEPVVAARRLLLTPSAWVLVAASDPPLLALLGSPDALLTRLDGEWWI